MVTDTARRTPRRGAPHPADEYEGPLPPHNLEAEQAVLGCVLAWGPAWETVRGMLAAEDFYKPAHQHVWDAMVRAWRDTSTTDIVAVADMLRQDGLLDNVGGPGFLLELQAVSPAYSRAAVYAKIVRDTAEARRLVTFLSQASMSAYDTANDAGELYEEVIRELQSRRSDFRSLNETVTTPTLEQLLLQEWQPADWVWPGMLAKGHRKMLAGRGGAGKSTFYRQGIVYSAAGLHPYMGTLDSLVWTGRQIRSLVVDLENDQDAWRLETRGMMEFVRAQTGASGLPIHVHALGGRRYDPVNSRADRADLWARLKDVQPDLLFFGPIYKLDQQGDDSWHRTAGTIQHLLDEAREAFGCAVILEAHLGKAGSDPRGAADWTYWPELGLTLSKVDRAGTTFKLRHFRGRRFASLYGWFPDEAYRYQANVMPWRLHWPEEHLTPNGYAWDQPPAPLPEDPRATPAAAGAGTLDEVYGGHQPF